MFFCRLFISTSSIILFLEAIRLLPGVFTLSLILFSILSGYLLVSLQGIRGPTGYEPDQSKA